MLADSGSQATATANAAATPDSRSPSSLAYYGILGEVARPGVYQLSTGCTLGQLVIGAGGLTGNANGNALVFRGARLAEQFFVAASESAVLSRRLDRRRRRRRGWPDPNGARTRHAPAQVQIGLLNLISRPVALTLPRELASPTHGSWSSWGNRVNWRTTSGSSARRVRRFAPHSARTLRMTGWRRERS